MSIWYFSREKCETHRLHRMRVLLLLNRQQGRMQLASFLIYVEMAGKKIQASRETEMVRVGKSWLRKRFYSLATSWKAHARPSWPCLYELYIETMVIGPKATPTCSLLHGAIESLTIYLKTLRKAWEYPDIRGCLSCWLAHKFFAKSSSDENTFARFYFLSPEPRK